MTTIGMVCAAVCISAFVAVGARLIGHYGPDHVLQVIIVPMLIVGLLSLLTLDLAWGASPLLHDKRR